MFSEFSRDTFRNILLWTQKVRQSPEIVLLQITELLMSSIYISGQQSQLLIFLHRPLHKHIFMEIHSQIKELN